MIGEIQGCAATTATNYHYGAFPPASLDFERLAPVISKSAAALARYDAALRNLYNKQLLLAPLRHQEAVISSRIEGTITTLEEVLKFEADEDDKEILLSSKEVVEVISYSRALNHAQRLINDGLPLCGRLIREIHGKLLFLGRGADKKPGEFKTEQNYVVDKINKQILFIPVRPNKLQDGVAELEKFMNRMDAEPLIQTALSHVEFEALHPFKDGNGRVGRMLIPLFLWTKGLISAPHFYVSSTIEENKDEYIDRLRRVSSNGEWTEWCLFFLNIIEREAAKNLEIAEKIHSLYEQMKITFTRELASKWMVTALDYMFANPIFRNSSFANKTAIPKQTAARFTKILASRKILLTVREASGRRSAMYAFEPLLNIVRS